jgi:hypothetical protein
VKVKLATVWRLTFEPYPHAHKGPTNEWRDWRPEQNPREQILNGSGAKTEPVNEKPTFMGANLDPDNFKNGRNPPNRTGSISAPHLDMPEGTVVRDDALGSNSSLFCPQILDGTNDPHPMRSLIAGYYRSLSAKRRRTWAGQHGVSVDDLKQYLDGDPNHLPAAKVAAIVCAIKNEKADARARNREVRAA